MNSRPLRSFPPRLLHRRAFLRTRRASRTSQPWSPTPLTLWISSQLILRHSRTERSPPLLHLPLRRQLRHNAMRYIPEHTAAPAGGGRDAGDWSPGPRVSGLHTHAHTNRARTHVGTHPNEHATKHTTHARSLARSLAHAISARTHAHLRSSMLFIVDSPRGAATPARWSSVGSGSTPPLAA
jgi:hypothetical protein